MASQLTRIWSRAHHTYLPFHHALTSFPSLSPSLPYWHKSSPLSHAFLIIIFLVFLQQPLFSLLSSFAYINRSQCQVLLGSICLDSAVCMRLWGEQGLWGSSTRIGSTSIGVTHLAVASPGKGRSKSKLILNTLTLFRPHLSLIMVAANSVGSVWRWAILNKW